MTKPMIKRDIYREISKPDCVSVKQFGVWMEVAEIDPPFLKAGSGFCEDCLPDYQRRMKFEGRCSHPEIRFLVDNDGFIDGVSPEYYEFKAERQREDGFLRIVKGC